MDRDVLHTRWRYIDKDLANQDYDRVTHQMMKAVERDLHEE